MAVLSNISGAPGLEFTNLGSFGPSVGRLQPAPLLIGWLKKGEKVTVKAEGVLGVKWDISPCCCHQVMGLIHLLCGLKPARGRDAKSAGWSVLKPLSNAFGEVHGRWHGSLPHQFS